MDKGICDFCGAETELETINHRFAAGLCVCKNGCKKEIFIPERVKSQFSGEPFAGLKSPITIADIIKKKNE
jgi:hypothetical protein